MLSTILGVVLAAAMIVSLSALTTVEQSPAAMRSAEQPPPEAAPSVKGPGGAEDKSAEQAQEGPQDQMRLATSEAAPVAVDPTMVGTPFALALLAGASVFLLVKKRVK